MAESWIIGDRVQAHVGGHGAHAMFISIEDPAFNAGGGVALVHVKSDPAVAESRAQLFIASPGLLAACESVLEAFTNDYIPDTAKANAMLKVREAVSIAKGIA